MSSVDVTVCRSAVTPVALPTLPVVGARASGQVGRVGLRPSVLFEPIQGVIMPAGVGLAMEKPSRSFLVGRRVMERYPEQGGEALRVDQVAASAFRSEAAANVLVAVFISGSPAHHRRIACAL